MRRCAFALVALSVFGTIPARMNAQSSLARRGALGVSLSAITDSSRAALRLAPTDTGPVIIALSPGSTATALGLREGDVVLTIDGTRTRLPADVVRLMSGRPAGSALEITRVRAGRAAVVRGALQPRPLERTATWETHALEVGTPGARQRVLATRPLGAGRHPVLMVIGGVGGYSLDGPLASIPYGPIIRAFADAGWATLRVDKPGQGDSEGGPIATLRFEQELAGYRAALRVLAEQSWADTSRVVVFGHSMGGSFAPILAGEFPMIKGVAVSATIGVSFAEYWLVNLRRQSELGGTAPGEVDALMRDAARLTPLVLQEGASPVDVAQRHPALAASVHSLFPDGQTLSGMGLDFFRELSNRNVGETWARVTAKVLALAGEADFVATREDHPRIAAMVNAAHPGRATYRLLERTDHGFLTRASEADAYARTGEAGAFNPLIVEVLMAWAREWGPG